jgi:hypothetical protein
MFYELYVLIMDNIIKFLSSYVLNMDNITILLINNLCFIHCNLYLLFFIKSKKKLLKSDVEFFKYIVIFSWNYILPCASSDNKILKVNI